jgi:hypothetical protein
MLAVNRRSGPKSVRAFRSNDAVTDLLRSFDAFSAFNAVFDKYGLRVWIEVEKVATVQNKALGLP